MNQIPADIRAAVPKLPENATEEELYDWIAALPPCPGIGFADDDDDEEGEAASLAEFEAGGGISHEIMCEWLDTWERRIDCRLVNGTQRGMAKVTWSLRASEDLDEIAAYIEMFDPDAAEQIRQLLKALGNSLGQFPNRGRPASRGTREMVTVRPYIMRYRVVGQKVLILRVRHSARRPLR